MVVLGFNTAESADNYFQTVNLLLSCMEIDPTAATSMLRMKKQLRKNQGWRKILKKADESTQRGFEPDTRISLYVENASSSYLSYPSALLDDHSIRGDSRLHLRYSGLVAELRDTIKLDFIMIMIRGDNFEFGYLAGHSANKAVT